MIATPCGTVPLMAHLRSILGLEQVERPSRRDAQVEITDAIDHYAHRITDDAHMWGVQAGQGAFYAMCGKLIVADSLSAPAAPLCPACRAAS